MLNNKVNFDRICEVIPNWTWNELRIGLEKSIISNSEIISYAILILSEGMEQFDRVLELVIAEEDEAEEIILNLAFKEGESDLEKINSKWIFAIIYDAYCYLNSEIYNVIEDVYAEFEYPEEIRNLINYMPCDDSGTLDEKLDKYIKIGKTIWC